MRDVEDKAGEPGAIGAANTDAKNALVESTGAAGEEIMGLFMVTKLDA